MSLSKTKTSFFILCLFFASLLLLEGNRPANADYYRYTDKTGTVCMTNTLDSVPHKYRATMKVIREETLAKKDRRTRIESPHDAPPQPAAGVAPEEKKDVTPPEQASPLTRLASAPPWEKAALIACVIACLFLIVRKLTNLLPSALLAKVVCLAFFLGTFVFLYKTYTDHLTNSFFTIKSRMIAMFEKSDRREAPDPLEKHLQER